MYLFYVCVIALSGGSLSFLPLGEAKAEGLRGTDNSSHGYRSVSEEHLRVGLVLPAVKSSTGSGPLSFQHCS